MARGHNRDLDPGFEEDPDIFLVLEDVVFYQASYDGTEVAIIADYPGLLPASHVSKTGVPTSEKDPLFRTSPTIYTWHFTGRAFGTPCRAHGNTPTGGTEAR